MGGWGKEGEYIILKAAQDPVLCRFIILLYSVISNPNYFACSRASVTVVMSQTSAGP